MSLIKCPVCRSHFSVLEASCPNCGLLLTEELIKNIKAEEKEKREQTLQFKNYLLLNKSINSL